MTSSKIGKDTTTQQDVEISKKSRLLGTYIIGNTGTGKTQLLLNLILQDIKQGIGLTLIDPHGDLTNAALSLMPPEREKDVILLDLSDVEFPFGLNFFAADKNNPLEAQRRVDQVMQIFEKLYDIDRSNPLMSQYLRNCSHTLITNGYTLAEVYPLLTKESFRKHALSNVTDWHVKDFWEWFENRSKLDREREISATINKVDEIMQYVGRYIVGQTTTTIDFYKAMNEGKIILLKLDMQMPNISSLLGAIILAELLQAAYKREQLPQEKRRQHNLYCDEVQLFQTQHLANIFSEARKYGLNATIAHQYREQLDQKLQQATFSIGNMIVFKVSGADGARLASSFDHTPPQAVKREDLIRDVISYLLSTSHPNPSVEFFVKNTLKPFIDLKQEVDTYNAKHGWNFSRRWVSEPGGRKDIVYPIIPKFIFRGVNPPLMQTVYDHLNDDLFEIMSMNQFHVDQWVFTWLANYTHRLTRGPQKRSGDSETVHIPGCEETIEIKYDSHIYVALQMSNLESKWKKYGEHNEKLLESISLSYSFLWSKLMLNNTLKDMSGFNDYEKVLALHLQRQPTFQDYLDLFREYVLDFFVDNPVFARRVGSLYYQGKLMTTPYTDNENIEDYLEETLLGEQKDFIAFFRELVLAMIGLQEQPLSRGSSTQRTYQDMENEIASMLANLPQYTAHTKISSEGKYIEHTIKTTIPSERRIGTAQLQDRIRRIKTNNRKEGYTRSRMDVEAEIRKRLEPFKTKESEQNTQKRETKPLTRRGPISE